MRGPDRLHLSESLPWPTLRLGPVNLSSTLAGYTLLSVVHATLGLRARDGIVGGWDSHDRMD
jgi:hypothetical protein